MSLLTRSLESFRSVLEASQNDQLLRCSNVVVAIFPFYTAVGYVCQLHYVRYLERRTKRLARASSCSAELHLSVSRDVAEKDAWQIEVLKAVAELLKLPETRFSLQGLSESRGCLILKLLLTRPAEAEDSGSCISHWQRLKSLLKVSQSEALSSITEVVLEGQADGQKIYSFFLKPSGQALEACKKAQSDLGGPSFEPHVTLLDHLAGQREEVLSLAANFARETAPVDLDFDKVVLGKSFFRSVYLSAEKKEIMNVFESLKARLPKTWLPEALGGSSLRWLDELTRKEGFNPHLSLAYLKEVKSPDFLASSANFSAKELSVYEVEPEDLTCSWKMLESYKLEGKAAPTFWPLFWRFSQLAAPEFLRIGLATALSVGANVLSELACNHDSELYSGAHVGESNEALLRVLGRGLLLWGTMNQLHDLSHRLMKKAGQQIGTQLQEKLFESLIQQDVKWIQQKGADELYKTLTQRTKNVQQVFTREIPDLIHMATNLVTNICFLWLSKPRLCAFGFGMFAFQNIGNSFCGCLMQVARDHDVKLGEVKENALEVLQNFRIVRAFAREEKEKSSFKSCMAQGRLVRMSDYVEKLVDVGYWFTSEFTFQAAYMYGGVLVNAKYLKPSEVKDSVSKCFRAVWPLYQLRRKLTQKSSFLEDAQAVLEALERTPDIPYNDDHMFNPRCQEVRGEIQAKGASFSYGDSLEGAAVKDLNFHIPSGSMVGLVGPSGCGKSTLFNLLLRFYDPQAGSIAVDGVDLARWNPQALYRAVSWVSQDQCVFQGSVIENIRYGQPDASEEQVLRVMREADLYDDVMKKPQGVETPANELSGGQKQRLSIARALLRDPKILLLDEATSALDTVSERKVQKALEKLMKGRTVIAIAHRLSTIMNADLILVMEAGGIIEKGSHSELLKKMGKYANLVQQQLAVQKENDGDKSTDPKAVEDCASLLENLKAKAPDFAEEVDQALTALRNAAATLREEKKRLAIKEQSLLRHGSSKWKKAGATVQNALRAVKLMRASSEGQAAQRSPPLLQRARSAEEAHEPLGLGEESP